MLNSIIDTVKEIENFINNYKGSINQSSVTTMFTDKDGDIFDVAITYTRREQKKETAGFKTEEENKVNSKQ